MSGNCYIMLPKEYIFSNTLICFLGWNDCHCSRVCLDMKSNKVSIKTKKRGFVQTSYSSLSMSCSSWLIWEPQWLSGSTLTPDPRKHKNAHEFWAMAVWQSDACFYGLRLCNVLFYVTTISPKLFPSWHLTSSVSMAMLPKKKAYLWSACRSKGQ